MQQHTATIDQFSFLKSWKIFTLECPVNSVWKHAWFHKSHHTKSRLVALNTFALIHSPSVLMSSNVYMTSLIFLRHSLIIYALRRLLVIFSILFPLLCSFFSFHDFCFHDYFELPQVEWKKLHVLFRLRSQFILYFFEFYCIFFYLRKRFHHLYVNIWIFICCI